MIKVEDSIQRNLIIWCDRTELFRAPYRFHVKNEGKKTKGEARQDKRMGNLAGVPDLGFILPDGRTVWLELKKIKGRTSAAQKELHKAWADRGHIIFVAYGYNHAIEILNEVRGWYV